MIYKQASASFKSHITHSKDLENVLYKETTYGSPVHRELRRLDTSGSEWNCTIPVIETKTDVLRTL